ncbi:putative MFS toxin transporter [Lophiotrema nucula]|uniref:Putative MFS toxin transporter n=1 Tax=Lophiotrema nucula TaxID=690887 RepID=A0A6A5ZIC8_9PLEO|nr:putative MFS toxin transporter [Lophiotrema nucula]
MATSFEKSESNEALRERSEVLSDGDERDEAHYLSGWPLGFLMIALMASSFMLALDNTILATAIPEITSDFNSLNDIGWYGSAYLITQMSLLPTCGRIYTFLNVKYTYISALLIFEIGSIVCAASLNSVALIVGRAIAGGGAAVLVSGAVVIINYCVELKSRALLMGCLSAVYGTASVTGPLIGGVITDNKTLTWRFCFRINLPFGAIAIGLICWTLKKTPPAAKAGLPSKEKIKQLNLLGALFLVAATTCLLLALQWGGIVYHWSDSRVYGCLIGFILLVTVFICLQFRLKGNSTISLHIFQSRTMCAACGFMTFNQLAVVAQIYYWPIYLQSVRNTSARTSGLYTLPLIVSCTICTLSVGWIISCVGYYVPFMWSGAPVLATGSGLFLLITTHAPAWRWVLPQIISGIGYGLCTQIPLLSVQVVLEKADVPTGCVMVLFFQCLGGALATSISQNLFTDTLLRRLGGIDGLHPAAIVEAGARDFRNFIVSDHVLESVIEAFVKALRNVFILAMASAALALLASLMMEWRRLPRKKKGAPTPRGGV